MRIMVVDNDPVYLNLLAEVLRLHSFEILTALNGEEALHLLRTEPVDFVISDISMPKMNGMHLYRAMREDPKLQKIPFAWNSGYRELRDAIEILNPELEFKLEKSLPIPSLIHFVSQVEKKLRSAMVPAG